MTTWYTFASQEFGHLAGEQLDHAPGRFKWASPLIVNRQPWTGTSECSSMWRNLARRAEESSRMLLRLRVGEEIPQGIHDHCKASGKAAASLCNSARAEVQSQVKCWAAAFCNAIQFRSDPWLHSLKFVADIKAAKLEASVASSRIKEWKLKTGALPPKVGGSRCQPSALTGG